MTTSICPFCQTTPLVMLPVSDRVMPGVDFGPAGTQYAHCAFVRAQMYKTQCCGHEWGRWFACDTDGQPLPGHGRYVRHLDRGLLLSDGTVVTVASR